MTIFKFNIYDFDEFVKTIRDIELKYGDIPFFEIYNSPYIIPEDSKIIERFILKYLIFKI